MNLEVCKQKYYDSSQQASDLGRNLAFAGIAVVWIFKESPTNKLPIGLIVPCLFFVLTLLLDFLQYATATLLWGARNRLEERKLDDIHVDKKTVIVTISPYFNWPMLSCFWAELAAISFAYVWLFGYIIIVWWVSPTQANPKPTAVSLNEKTVPYERFLQHEARIELLEEDMKGTKDTMKDTQPVEAPAVSRSPLLPKKQ